MNFHISAKCQLNENQQQIKQLGESRLGEKVALGMAVRAKGRYVRATEPF